MTVISVLFLFYSCQDDEITNSESLASSKKINLWRFPAEQVFRNKPNVKSKIDRLKKENLQARLTSSVYDFSIEENEVQVIFGENYTQYTFEVSRNNTNNDILENYICKVFNDGTINQFLVTYPKSIDSQGNIHFDATNSSINLIDDQDLIVSQRTNRTGFPSGCVPELINESWDYVCENIPCTGYGHTVGQDCDCGVTTDCEVAHTECSWVQTMVYGCGGGGGTGDDSSNDGSDLPQGGNSSTENDNTEDEITTVPFDDTRARAKECEKIKNFLDNNSNFKNELLSLNQDLNNNYEVSISKFETITTIVRDQGLPNEPEVRILRTPSKDYEAFAHTHYEDPITPNGDTYSVFSTDDLEVIAEIINGGYAVDDFVIFLSTGKGTYYAMTINDKNKFLSFFYTFLNPSLPSTSDYNVLRNYLDKQKKYKGLKEKYFTNENEDPLITKENSSNNVVLSHFLNYLKEADMGVNMFKSNSNFDTFDKVSYDNSSIDNIKIQPCNN